MRKRPILFTTQPTSPASAPLYTSGSDLVNTQTGSYPRARPSTYEQLIGQSGQSVPLPILGVVAVEGVDYPFRSRLYADNLQGHYRRGWIERRLAAQPAVPSVPLVLIAPVDTTPLFVGKHFEVPISWRFKVRRHKNLVANTPASSDWGARTAAYLPATVYPDTACRIYSEIQRHMLEPVVDGGLTWTVWTTAEVAGYLTQRLTRFMVDSGLIREQREVTPVLTRDADLPSDTLEVMRTVWNDAGVRGVLTRVDKWALDNGQVGWQSTTGTPIFYTEDTNSALGVEVAPSPATPGTLELIIIAAPELAPKHCYSVPLPAIFTPYLKYGVMADMLSKEGEAHDPQRAEYCESRFAEGVELAKLFFAGGKAQ